MSFLATLSAMAVLLQAPGTGAVDRRPNVVMILVDDLGWRDTTPYGSTFYRTPNVERLAARGMRFTNAYSANPLCSPTRASILTGQYPCRLGITVPAGHIRQEVLEATLLERGPARQKVVTPISANRLPLEAVTLAEALEGAGYATAHIGKWHLGWEPYGPEAQGFDLVAPGGSYPGPPGTYFAPFRAPIFPDAPAGRHIDELCTDAAIRFIEERRHAPFFLNYWMFSVHAPYDGARGQQIEAYRARADVANPQRNPIMAGMIETMDACVGRILDTLDRLDLSRDTMIVFTGDNGGVSWQEVEGAPVTSNLPLRNGKASIYEGGTRENLIVVWPGKVAPGSRSEALVSSIDHYPTLLEVARVPRPEGHLVDGVSYRPALEGTGSPGREAVFCHFPHYVPASGNTPATSVRQGDWKLVRSYGEGPRGSNRLELYNLALDPGESVDRAADEPELMARLDRLIDAHLRDTGALVPRPNPAYDQAPGRWSPSRDAQLGRDAEAIMLTSTGPDPFITTRELGRGRGPYRLSFRITSTSTGQGRVYWSSPGERGFSIERSVGFTPAHDGAAHDVTVVLRPEGQLNALRIDPGTGPGSIRLERVKLLDQEGRDMLPAVP